MSYTVVKITKRNYNRSAKIMKLMGDNGTPNEWKNRRET